LSRQLENKKDKMIANSGSNQKKIQAEEKEELKKEEKKEEK